MERNANTYVVYYAGSGCLLVNANKSVNACIQTLYRGKKTCGFLFEWGKGKTRTRYPSFFSGMSYAHAFIQV
jgi:hypothetical protein